LYFITIPIEYNCYFFLKRPDLYFRKSDIYGITVGSIVRDTSRYTNTHKSRLKSKTYRRAKKLPTGYDRKKYPCEIRLWFGDQFADRINKITEHSVVAVNNLIRLWIRDEFIIYIRHKTEQHPDRMQKDHIYYFCEEYGLMVNDTFFETLKKFEYRRRKKEHEST
jgi:hypothetical protein